MNTGPLTITAAAESIRRGELTPTALLDQCLARIDRYESRVRAWVVIDRDGARAQAERLTAELQAGQNRGPLHGIPIGVKDIIDVFDLPTGCGSKLWANSYARRDATCVARLRQAGAVILGKTVTTAYASFDPPVTRNPWNLERTPGGSSSGSAAAVACGMCLGALATQTGGSITRPASYCGVYSLKPTYGRVSVDGVLPLAPSMDHVGVMANCVRDLAIMFQVIAGPDKRDSEAAKSNNPDVLWELGRRLHSTPSADEPPFVCRLRGLFRERAEPLMWDVLDDAFNDFVGKYRDHVSHEVSVPPAAFADVLRWHRTVMAVEAASYHRNRIARHPDDYPPHITRLIEEGLNSPATDYAEARAEQARLAEEVNAGFGRSRTSVYLTPAATSPAPLADSTGDPAMNSPWSFLGLPTVSLPVGWSAAEEGALPLATQVTGRRQSESSLLAFAAMFEATVGEFHPRPLPL